jgi:large subunit ribosomal protein L6
MSRIGKSPVTIPSGVEVKVDGNLITVKGPKGVLTQEFDSCVGVTVENGTVTFTRESDAPSHRSKHGLYRALVNNMVIGVSEGFKKELEIVGVGYRANANGQKLELALGYSHPYVFELPSEIKVSALSEKGKAPVVTLESHDKQLVGQVAAKIRSLRKPEPYKGKGIRFVGEEIRRKAGKSAGK